MSSNGISTCSLLSEKIPLIDSRWWHLISWWQSKSRRTGRAIKTRQNNKNTGKVILKVIDPICTCRSAPNNPKFWDSHTTRVVTMNAKSRLGMTDRQDLFRRTWSPGEWQQWVIEGFSCVMIATITLYSVRFKWGEYLVYWKFLCRIQLQRLLDIRPWKQLTVVRDCDKQLRESRHILSL